jgi:hypothetical protein
MIKRLLINSIIIFFFTSLSGQNLDDLFVKPYFLDAQQIIKTLEDYDNKEPSVLIKNQPYFIQLLDIRGKTEKFELIETPVIPLPLSLKYPTIRTYSGKSISNPSEKISITTFQNELLISLHLNNEIIRIAKEKGSKQYFAKYSVDNEDLKITNCCDFESDKMVEKEKSYNNLQSEIQHSIGDSLYLYRIGMILSSEANAQVADGTVEGGLAWVADMINRCNLVWVRDFGSKLVLPENADLLICTTDNKGYFPSPPFDSPTHYLLQYIEPMIDELIGANNYEYGHLVTPGVGGGWAALSSKRGVSDPNYEVIIHEIGHQLGSHHNLVEEGAQNAWSIGGTIMGSRSNTVDNNEKLLSGDQYSSHTIDIAVNRQRNLINSFANGWYHEASGNSVPVITEMPPNNITIPIKTPFYLEGKAEDDNGDELTYTWEQNDRSNISFNVPEFPEDSGPLFVSVFPSKLGSKRYFPNLNDLLENNYTFKEYLPFSSRELNFRFIVRDNNLVSGGYTYKNVTLFSDQNSGPFQVTSLNEYEIFSSGSEVEITWDVANTNLSSVNCQTVSILLSSNGGESFDYILAENTVNDGIEKVVMPNIIGNNNRIMVKAEDNIFFDVNNNPFELHDPDVPGLFITVDNQEIKILNEDSLSIRLSSRALGPISEDLKISIIKNPHGIQSVFYNNDTTLITNATSENLLYLKDLNKLPQGRHSLIVKFEVQDVIETIDILLLKTGEIFVTPGFCSNISKSKNQNIIIPNFNINTNNFSFMAWIKPVGTQDPYSGIFCFEGNTTAALNFKENNELGYHWEGGSWSWNSGLFVKEGEWNHVALVSKQNSITLYLNGKQSVHSIDAEKIVFNNIIRLGSYKNWSGRNYNGLIDEVSFWNKSLEKEEISNFHNTLKGNEEGLLAYYQFNRYSIADAIGGFTGDVSSGSLDYFASTAPFGNSDISVNKERFGLVEYPEAGLSVNYSTQNGFEVIAAKINSEPNSFEGITENENPLTEQYWVYHRASSGGVYMGDFSFNVIDIHSGSSYDLPSDYSLYNRSAGSEKEWKFLQTASEIDKTNKNIKFDKIFKTGQFLITKKQSTVGVDEESKIPDQLMLFQNYPNPFNPSTNITFGIPKESRVKVTLYDILGNQIRILIDSPYSAGYHSLLWDGKNENGKMVSSGIYFYKIKYGFSELTKKMILLR